jgi:transposase
MAKPLLTDELWARLEPFIPPRPPRPRGGRPPLSDRACLTGILFVLRSGIPWQLLPPEMGCGSGMTCWRRLRDWQKAGVWQAVWHAFLDQLGEADRIDWSKVVIDSSSTRAVLGGSAPAPTPPTAAKMGRNATWSPTAPARLWPSPTPAPTATTPTWL